MQDPTKRSEMLDKSKTLTRRKLLLDAAASATAYSLCKTNAFAEPEYKSVYIATDIAKAVEEIAPISTGYPNDQLGFIYGDPSTEVKGVACVWQVDATSIPKAAEQDLNIIICHERLWNAEWRF